MTDPNTIVFRTTEARTYYVDKDGNEIAPPAPAKVPEPEKKEE